jgi:hypothetical protein
MASPQLISHALTSRPSRERRRGGRHVPWQYLPDGRGYRRAGRRPSEPEEGRAKNDPFLARQLYKRHLLQVGFTDRPLGRLIARLRQTALGPRARGRYRRPPGFPSASARPIGARPRPRPSRTSRPSPCSSRRPDSATGGFRLARSRRSTPAHDRRRPRRPPPVAGGRARRRAGRDTTLTSGGASSVNAARQM